MEDPVSREEHERVVRENVALREQLGCLRSDIDTLVTLLLSPCEHGEERESVPPSPEPAPGTASWQEPRPGTGMISADRGRKLQHSPFGYHLTFG